MNTWINFYGEIFGTPDPQNILEYSYPPTKTSKSLIRISSTPIAYRHYPFTSIPCSSYFLIYLLSLNTTHQQSLTLFYSFPLPVRFPVFFVLVFPSRIKKLI